MLIILKFSSKISGKTIPSKLHLDLLCLETKKLLTEAIYLEDNTVEIMGKTFYGVLGVLRNR